MSELNDQIRDAIDSDHTSRAADLVKEAMDNNPDAETYFQAARIASDDAESAKLLRTAIALDPDHEQAKRALENLEGGDNLIERMVDAAVPDLGLQVSSAPLGVSWFEWLASALALTFVPAMPIIAFVLGNATGSTFVTLVALAVALPLSIGMIWFVTGEFRKRIRERAQLLSQNKRSYA